MKNKHNGGFSLIEVMLSIVILAAIVVPTCTSLVLSYRLNAKSEELMQAQLAVSSAVETLMAEGITGNDTTDYGYVDGQDRFPDVVIQVTKEDTYYTVVVTDNDGLVTVTTQIRAQTGGGST